MAAGDVTSDHHLSVDAVGSAQPQTLGSHLMRKVVPHESPPIESHDFGGLVQLDDLLELADDDDMMLEEDDYEDMLIPTYYHKLVNKKKIQSNCQVRPASTAVTQGGGAGTWHSDSSFRYQQVSQCKSKCTANTGCKCFEVHKNRTPKRCDFKTACTGLAATPTSGDTSYDFYKPVTATSPYTYTKTASKKIVGYRIVDIKGTLDSSTASVVSTGGTTSSKAGTAARWRKGADGSTISCYYYTALNDCKIFCSAKTNCAAFIDFKNPAKELKHCCFCSNSGNQTTATNVDVYVRSTR
eukprot:gnl/MRDRNA2_/MRDRNA2_113100_c0_seq1.p1 gnl/MRDRNA2_/MRDRNA2_113100_c0~~gnl/MRDRNA2_/MRDRNA2_113100_c0_seq1.p1  ORF type:complete len:332 (-),score=42.92 gnl/MRDRNA2_/MRDRNA2_113100_c0_seq1:130-1020(-)